MLLEAVVHSANIHDSKSADNVISKLAFRSPNLKTIFADGGYRGELIEGVKEIYGWFISIALRSDKSIDFQPLPKRWAVERTFALFESYRRLSKDFEYLTDTSEAMIKLPSIRLLLNRITLSSESLNFKKPGESNIFVSTKKLEYYGTLQAEQKYQQTSNKSNS